MPSCHPKSPLWPPLLFSFSKGLIFLEYIHYQIIQIFEFLTIFSFFFSPFCFIHWARSKIENICKNEPVKTCPTIYNLYSSKSIQGWCKITSIFGRKMSRPHQIEQEGTYFIWCKYDGEIKFPRIKWILIIHEFFGTF